tara:strand:+ start:163 stop:570 length:408 start_codon:yes stop_codon:yes gene_type:complete
MASVLLPPAVAAKGFVDSAIPINVTATAALSGYGGAIAAAVTALASATASVTSLQTVLLPLGAITPPSRIGTNITAAILAQIVTVNATIVATTTQSVAAAGAPSPTFPASAALVGTQLSTISAAIQTGLIQPQMV